MFISSGFNPMTIMIAIIALVIIVVAVFVVKNVITHRNSNKNANENVDSVSTLDEPTEEESEEVAQPTEEESEEVAQQTEEESEEIAQQTEEESEEVAQPTEEESEEVVQPTEEESEEVAQLAEESEEVAQPTEEESEEQTAPIETDAPQIEVESVEKLVGDKDEQVEDTMVDAENSQKNEEKQVETVDKLVDETEVFEPVKPEPKEKNSHDERIVPAYIIGLDDLTVSGKVDKKVVLAIQSRSLAEKLRMAEESTRQFYDELKTYILNSNKDIRSRVSKTADSFRLHRKLLFKLFITGKTLKLALALNPANEKYDQNHFPHIDKSETMSYYETPFVMKVKSNLAIKRAKKLIDDVVSIESGH